MPGRSDRSGGGLCREAGAGRNVEYAPELFAATALVSLLSVGVVLRLERLNRRLGHWR